MADAESKSVPMIRSKPFLYRQIKPFVKTIPKIGQKDARATKPSRLSKQYLCITEAVSSPKSPRKKPTETPKL